MSASAPQKTKQIADLLVDYLEQLSVEYVFGVPGGAIEGLYNALARSQRRGGPRSVVARHETGAAFMADGYYRETGRLGVCCATTGPGATNLITGVASAYENQIPMLVVTAQTALSHFGKDALQESSCTGVNTVGMFQFCTRYNTLVSHAEQFEHKLASAVMAAFRSPFGPVHLSIPKDILNSPSQEIRPRFQLTELLGDSALIDDNLVLKLYQEIRRAGKVALMIGSGCHESLETILELAQVLQAEVVSAPHGKGLINAYYPAYRGVIGFGGHNSARAALTNPQVDSILAIGTNLGEWASNGWDTDSLLNSRLIHIDDNEEHLAHSPMAKLHVRGHLPSVMRRLLEYLKQDTASSLSSPTAASNEILPFQLDDPAAYQADGSPIKPQRLMRELAKRFPPSTRFLADAGNSQAWAIHYLHPPKPSIAMGNFRSCLEFASMGWAIGAAVGTAIGQRGTPVVCITGDGSLLMSGQELTVAAQEKLPVIFVILNDSALGMVKHGQRLGGAEAIGFELPEIDYCAYAQAMGVPGHIIRAPQDFDTLDIGKICERAGPTLLDIRIDPEEIPPIATRMKVLGWE